jgi:hypothetical protein
MAKKKPSKSKPKSSGTRSRKPGNPLFMTSPQDDLAALFALAGKGPHKDQASARLVTPVGGSGNDDPASRES